MRRTARRGQSLTVWLLILSITGLALITFLPWISVSEDLGDLYFNYDMMKTSTNQDIVRLAGDLNIVSILFWVVIALSLISFVLLIFHLSLNASNKQSIMLVVSIIILILSILIVYKEYAFTKTVEGMSGITLANIVFLIKYAYIPLLFAILLTVFSAYYTGIVALYYTKQKKTEKKEQKVETKPVQPQVAPKISKPISKPIPPPIKTNNKQDEMEKWLRGQAQILDKKNEETELEKIEKETPEIKNEVAPQPFPPEEKKERPKDSEVTQTSKSFEKALSYAIEKNIKKPEKEIGQENENSDIDTESKISEPKDIHEEPIRKIKVRCPQCNNVFVAGIEGENYKIKCPTCGKEGNIKK